MFLYIFYSFNYHLRIQGLIQTQKMTSAQLACQLSHRQPRGPLRPPSVLQMTREA